MGFCCSRDSRAIVTGLTVPLRPQPLPVLEESGGKPEELLEDQRTMSVPLKLDLAVDTPDLQHRYEQVIQEKREVGSSCSIVTVHRFGSPLSHIQVQVMHILVLADVYICLVLICVIIAYFAFIQVCVKHSGELH